MNEISTLYADHLSHEILKCFVTIYPGIILSIILNALDSTLHSTTAFNVPSHMEQNYFVFAPLNQMFENFIEHFYFAFLFPG